MSKREIVLKPEDYQIGGDDSPGLVSRIFGWVDGLWSTNRQKRAERQAYKAQLKDIENQVYMKEKAERDIENAIEKGKNRAKPLSQKIEEMSEKLQEAGEKVGGPGNGNDSQPGQALKGDLFGNPMSNTGIDINTMFSNDKSNKRGKGRF